MVQVLPEVESFGAQFGRSVGQGLGHGLLKGQEKIGQMSQLREEDEAIEKDLGINLRGIVDPDLRRQRVIQELKGRQEKQQAFQNQFAEEESYKKIEEVFGKKFADIWKSSPVGGRTELLKHGIDSKLRGLDVDSLLGTTQSPISTNQNVSKTSDVPQMKNGKVSKDFDWPDFKKEPTGFTPKEWKDERKVWRKENSPIFLENKNKLQNSKRDKIAIKKLDKLNETRKVGEGFERTLINPSTGEPFGIAQITGQMSPETQEWIKETARFQNRAKDAFGSRVTNFDLVSYMKQFPGLLNTYEGRKRILRMMDINNELDQLYENALEKIYQHYSLNGIPMEEADNLAQSMIKEESERLSQEYLGLDETNQETDDFSGRMVDVYDPQGNLVGEIDESQIDQLPEGYRIK